VFSKVEQMEEALFPLSNMYWRQATIDHSLYGLVLKKEEMAFKFNLIIKHRQDDILVKNPLTWYTLEEYSSAEASRGHMGVGYHRVRLSGKEPTSMVYTGGEQQVLRRP
ncbi:11260_t:CDS:2, partial [Acaulospora morrowiae]